MLCEIDLFNPKELITQGKQFNSNKKKRKRCLGGSSWSLHANRTKMRLTDIK